MNKSAKNRFVMLVGAGSFPMILANGLYDHFGSFAILIEDKEPTKTMIRRRLKMLGLVETAGQVMFGVLQKFIHKFSDGKKQEIIATNNLKTDIPADCEIFPVGNINSDSCREKLRQLEPELVVVVGTRMITAKTLDSIDGKFINYHAGINPLYRGMNGGYWALANNDAENFGITVHLVDKGVDTGQVLSFKRLSETQGGNITTYPYIQAAAARELLVNSVESVLSGKIDVKSLEGESRQWFHPTLWGYLWTGLRRKIW